MRAWVVQEFGAAGDVLKIEDAPTREPGPGEVVVDYAAASLGFADNVVIAGNYQIQPQPPFTPGFEGAGTVSAVGPDVTGVEPGQRAIALPDLGEGVFREQGVAPAVRIHPIPDTLPFEQAAAMFVPYQTAMLALHRRARLETGETVVVHGAAGGVGSAAIQVAHAHRARVIACALNAEHARLCEKQGADRGVDMSSEDFVAVVKEMTGGRGADVIIDPVGGDVFEQSIRCIAPEGRLVVIGFAGGAPGELKLNHLLVKNFSVVGCFFGPGELTVRLNRENHERLMQMQAEGKITPLISEVIPFEEIPAALAKIAAGASYGKIVATI